MKTIEEKFQKLDEISHVLLRPGRYIGSISPHTAETWVVENDRFARREITWCPALLKTFDEIISNSVDFSKTEDGKHLSTIKVELNRETGELSVFDDGGIAVVKHRVHDQWIPELVFELRAGSNFNDDDDSITTGQNGEGAALTAIFSRSFHVKTADGKHQFEQTHLENSRKKTEPRIRESDKHFTKITWLPDYERFGLTGLDDGNFQRLVKRVYDVAGCNPNLKIYLNGQQIRIKGFDDYIKLYTDDFIYEENEHWRVGIARADAGFEHVSFVNGTETLIGGNHVSYIANQLTTRLQEFFKKKYKVDVKPADIRNHLWLFIDATIIRPRYSSQTKEDLITEIKSFGTSFTFSDKTINKLLRSPVIQSILDWVQAKAQAAALAEMRKLNKETEKANLKKIKKFHDATERDRSKTMVMFGEGDSACAALLAARDPRFHAVFPLRGRPINVSATTFAKIKENAEFENIRTIVGLKYGERADPAELNFGKIVIASDYDEFGHSIAGLIINMFYRLWPEIIKEGRLYRLMTPVVIVEYQKRTLEFFTEREFEEWREKHAGEKYDYTFLKGLGSSTPKQFKNYLSNLDRYLVQFTWCDDIDKMMDLCFSKEVGSSDARKAWLNLE